MNLFKKINFLNTLCNETLSITHYPGGFDVHSYEDCGDDCYEARLEPDIRKAVDNFILYLLDRGAK